MFHEVGHEQTLRAASGRMLGHAVRCVKHSRVNGRAGLDDLGREDVERLLHRPWNDAYSPHCIEAAHAHDQEGQRISSQADLELVGHGLSIGCFRYAPAGLRSDPEGLDALNKRIVERIQLGGRAFLTSTVLEGRFVLRACVINPRTTEAEIDALADLVSLTGTELA